MAGLNHQACGVLDLASAARCPDRALLSKHSNQNEKPDLGQESDAHDRDRKEHVARRERVHECLAPSEAPGVNHSGEKMFRFQTQTASGAGVRGGLRRSSANRMVRFGSIATKMGRRRDVRFPPDSDRTADIAGGPVGANTGLMQCSKKDRYSITSSAVARSVPQADSRTAAKSRTIRSPRRRWQAAPVGC
jgi:hypothetical protein